MYLALLWKNAWWFISFRIQLWYLPLIIEGLCCKVLISISALHVFHTSLLWLFVQLASERRELVETDITFNVTVLQGQHKNASFLTL